MARTARGPFAYEISIATHLMQKGWDVDFIDYSGAGRFDLLARQNGVEVEVECKTTSGDTGRKIHRQEANRLADLLLPITDQVADEAGCHRILVTIPDRLGKSTQELTNIASIVASAVQQKASASTDLCQVDYTFDGIDPWPEPNDPDILPFFERRFGVQNANLMFRGRSDFSIVAVMIRSAKADSVVDTISAQAKEAADQCSGTRPALIALHLIDELNSSDLQAMLNTSNGLHAITHAVLKGGKRQHVEPRPYWVTMPNADPEFLKGLSFWHHDQIREFAKAKDLEFSTEEQRWDAFNRLRNHWETLAGQMPMRETRQARRGLAWEFGQFDDTTVNEPIAITLDDIKDAEVEASTAGLNKVEPEGVPDQVAAELLDRDNEPNKGRTPSKVTIARGQRTKTRKKAENEQAEHDAYVKEMRGDPTGDPRARGTPAGDNGGGDEGWGETAEAPTAGPPEQSDDDAEG
jgi:hypothetical protein